jgi:hypothetical protein
MGACIYEENSTLTIAGNVFQQNTATIAGAGAYLTDSSVVIKAMDPDKIPNTFIANLAPDGAGLYCQGAISPTISRARFGENRGTRGAGMFLNSASPALSNLLIVGNSADQGGGIYCAGSRSSPTIKNCTLIANFADMAFGGGGVYTDLGSPQVSNSVLWGNRDDLANCSATYSDVQDGGAGAGNIIAEPLFMGPGFSGTITSISHWTNGTSGINFVGGGVKVDELIGLYLNPNIQQNVHFYIYDNTTSTLSVRGFAGYVATVGDQFQVWDWHEKSTGGHWGRNAWVLDPVTSPCINRGDPRDSVGKEPQPHGNRINMGHDGGTEQASKSGQVTPGGFQHGVISITDSWTQVTFPEEFSDAPVVIASPATENDRAPGVVRIRNVTKTSFQIRFQEWSYLDGSHGTETVHWVAVMKGVWNLGGGRKLFADTFVTNNTNVNLPLTVIFPESAGIVPVVLAQIQTYNDSHPVTHRICATFTTRFKIAMQEQMTSRRTHGRETIGYIAVNRGVTQIGNASCQVNITGTVVTDDPYLLYTAKGQCLIRVSEEQSKDKNTTHTKETVGYIALDGRLPVVADMQTCLGKDPADLRCKLLATNFQWERSYVAADHNWKTVNLKNTYTSPIVIAGPATYNDRTPGVVRVRQVGRTSFKIRFQEWKYIKDQRHRTEYIPYMVVEQGVWNINGAQTLVAHKPNVVGTTSLRFPAGFTVAPVVVATQQTANDPDPVTERLSLISTTAFRVALQEEQAGGAHGKETLGYVAVGAGTAGVQGGVVGLRTGTGNPQDWRIVITEEQSKDKETSHRAETIRYISFNGASHTRPYFVASMQTCNDPDPATLRCYTTLSSLEYGLAISAEDKEGQGLSAVAIQAAAQKDAEAAVILTDAEPVLRSYPSGTAVTVTAPDSLALAQRTLTFDHWEVDGEAQQAGLSTIKLLMTDNHSVAAVYELPPSSAP